MIEKKNDNETIPTEVGDVRMWRREGTLDVPYLVIDHDGIEAISIDIEDNTIMTGLVAEMEEEDVVLACGSERGTMSSLDEIEETQIEEA